MRIIRFRGKRIDGKGFAFGSLILPNSENENTYIQGWNGARFKVIPETICQFTGLYDKNGKEIYEGDVLKGYMSKTSLRKEPFKDCLFIVNFDKTTSSYYLNRITNAFGYRWLSHWEETEIIGNIHENPEFLENKFAD